MSNVKKRKEESLSKIGVQKNKRREGGRLRDGGWEVGREKGREIDKRADRYGVKFT